MNSARNSQPNAVEDNCADATSVDPVASPAQSLSSKVVIETSREFLELALAKIRPAANDGFMTSVSRQFAAKHTDTFVFRFWFSLPRKVEGGPENC